MSASILIVDDEEIVVHSTVRILEGRGYSLQTARDGVEALQKIDESHLRRRDPRHHDARMNGVEVLQRLKEAHPDIEVIMFTGLAEIATAVTCMKLGAFDYLAKPFEPEELALAVTRALEHRSLRQENLNLKLALSSKYRLDNMIGAGPRMQQVYRLIAQCATTNATVLITGESGTGKELIARAIHHNSLRKSKPFVAVDCNCAVGEPAGKRALRPRQGRVHGRGVRQEGHARDGRRGHAVPRRDLQYPARDPGEAAAGDPGARIPRGGRHPYAERRLPPDRRDQQGPEGDGGGAHLPRRPLLPHQRLSHRVAGAARSARGHSGARVPFREVLQRRSWARTWTRSPRAR